MLSFIIIYLTWTMVTIACWPFCRMTGLRDYPAWLCSRTSSSFIFAIVLMHLMKWTGLGWSAALFWCSLAIMGVTGWMLVKKQRAGIIRIFRRVLSFELFLIVAGLIMYSFFAAFLGMKYLGERTMDLGQFSILWTIPDWPPPDFWCAGKNLNTYFLGHFSLAAVSRGAFIPPWKAYLSGMIIMWLQLISASMLSARIFKLRGKWFLCIAPLIIMTGNAAFIFKWFQGLSPFRIGAIMQYTRIIPYTINEIPGISLWASEMHAHCLALPLLILLAIFIHLYLNYPKTGYSIGAGILFSSLAITDSWQIFPALVFWIIMFLFHIRNFPQNIKNTFISIVAAIISASAFLIDYNGYPLHILFLEKSTTNIVHLITIFSPLIILFGFLLPYCWKRKGPRMKFTGLSLFISFVALIIFCELWYIDNNFPSPGERQNTVFRFHFAAWSFLALAVILFFPSRKKYFNLRIFCSGILLLFFVFGSAVPGIIKIVADNPGPSVDVRPALDHKRTGRIEAAEWLFKNTPPDTVIMESAGPPYHGYGTVSAMSGRTAVLGETDKVMNHAVPMAEIQRRLNEIYAVYLNHVSSDNILRKYDVDYIILSPKEEQAFNGCRSGELIRKYKTVFREEKTRILKAE